MLNQVIANTPLLRRKNTEHNETKTAMDASAYARWLGGSAGSEPFDKRIPEPTFAGLLELPRFDGQICSSDRCAN